MTWFAAHIIIGLRLHDSDSCSAWENVFLINSDTVEDAFIEAEKIGKAEELINDDLEVGGKAAKRSFVGVRKIVEISNPSPPQSKVAPIHGCELTYSEFEVKSYKDLMKLGNGEKVSIKYTNN